MRYCRQSGMMSRMFVVLMLMGFCSGCVSIEDNPIENDFVAMRELTLETMHDRVKEFSEDDAFYCRIVDGWPYISSPRELRVSRNYVKFTVVKHGVDAPENGRLGEAVLKAVRKCTLSDAVPLGAISSRMECTAGLAWIANDGSSFAGIAVITSEGVYFIYTIMERFSGPGMYYECVYEELRKPPFYLWMNPVLGQHWGAKNRKKMDVSVNDMFVKSAQMYSNSDSNARWQFCFENRVTAFRIDIAPEKFQVVKDRRPGRKYFVDPAD